MALLWKRLDETGLELFELLSGPRGSILRGTIIALEGTEPVEVRYQIDCDSEWRTKRAEMSVRIRGSERQLSVTVNERRWYQNGEINETVDGCTDIDLGWSPSTNTLPIQRLKLAVGESSGLVTAAWVKLPDLTLRPLCQEYRRLTDRRYLYTSDGGSFQAELLIDDKGLIIEYENFWRRVGQVCNHETHQSV